MGKAKECSHLRKEGKMTESEVQSVYTRADTISHGTLAEMNHFQQERVKDFKYMMQTYLREQIKFYKQVETHSTFCLMHILWIKIKNLSKGKVIF